MNTYRVRRLVPVYEDVALNEGDLLTMTEAARLLGMSVQGVRSAIENGRLDMVEDSGAPQSHGRCKVLRSQVEGLLAQAQPAQEVKVAEAATILGVSKSRVSQLVKAGQLELSQAGVAAYAEKRKGTNR